MVFRDEGPHRRGCAVGAGASRERHGGERGGHRADHALLHGEEKSVHADAGYLGVEKRAEILRQCPGVAWHVAAKRGQVKAMAEGLAKELTVQLERLKAQVRARVEHPFHILKNLFRHRKARDRGLAKNTAQLHSLFALANLFLARRSLLSLPSA